MITREEIGANVRAVRRKRGWNQKELARRVKPKPLTKDTVSRIERGAANFTIDALLSIAEALKADLSDFCPDGKRDLDLSESPELRIIREAIEKVAREVMEKHAGPSRGSA